MQFQNIIIFGASGDVGNSFLKFLLPKSTDITLVVRSRSKIDVQILAMPNVSIIEFTFPEKVKELSEKLNSNDKHYDLIVNAIGCYNRTNDMLDVEHFKSLINSNFYVLQHILFILSPFVSSDSKLVNIGSIASHAGGPSEAAYSASKILCDNLIASLRANESYKNVRVLNVRPGAIISKMTSDREDSSKFIDPDELAELCISTVRAGNSLTVPSIDVYRRF